MKAGNLIYFFFVVFISSNMLIAKQPRYGILYSNQKNDRYDIVVAKDGSGNYTTIQDAINAVPDISQKRVTIFIKNGDYNEKIVIPSWKTKITLIGESKDSTIITYGDYHGKGDINTFTSYTVLVQGNDFHAENITFENSAGRVGQALALAVEADRCVIKNCRLIGNQDTLYAANDSSRQYYVDCYIEGTTDFIFGDATAVFKNCLIRSKKNSFVTAASTSPNQKFGYVFLDCKLIADSGITKVYLGRPWRPYAAVAYLKCYLGPQILPAGWNNWKDPKREKTARYSEYKSTGPGANPKKRVSWSKQLSANEARGYTLKNIFGNWSPEEN
ncbi:MAG: pectinesterase family protein [Ignavibacteriaceae bacterium]